MVAEGNPYKWTALAAKTSTLRVRQRSIARFSTLKRLDANEKCGRMGAHPAASAWGASGGRSIGKPRWKRCVERFIAPSQNPRNNAKALGSFFWCNSFAFNTLIALAGAQIFKFFLCPARPLNLHSLNFVTLAHTKSYR